MKLVIRVLITGSRLSPILLDWYLQSGIGYSIAFPIAMLLLASSSVPIHKNYYKTGLDSDRSDYVSGLGLIIILSLFFILLCEFLSDDFYFFLVFWIFLIEKVGDELGRLYTYRKIFNHWVYSQIIRFNWPVLLIIFHEKNLLKPSLEVILPLVVFIYLSFYFIKEVAVKAVTDSKLKSGINVITNNISYLPFAFLSGLFRQLPRIAVGLMFPSSAAMYLFFSQSTQFISLVFNARFVIPYRKVIAKRTYGYLKIINHFAPKFIIITVIIISIIIAMMNFLGLMQEEYDFAALLIGEAVLLVLLSSNIGCVVWVWSPKRAFAVSLQSLCLYLSTFISVFLLFGLMFTSVNLVNLVLTQLVSLAVTYRFILGRLIK